MALINDPSKKRPDEPAAAGYAAGEAARRTGAAAGTVMRNTPRVLAEATGVPRALRQVRDVAGGFAAGFSGIAARPQPNASTPAASTAPAASAPAAAAGGPAAAMPSINNAGPTVGSPATSGAIAPVPAPVATKPRAFDVGKSGERVYSNETLTRSGLLAPRVEAQQAAPAATSAAPPVAARPAPAAEPRPAAPAMRGAQGGVIRNKDEAQRRLQIQLDSIMRSPANTRSARAAQAQAYTATLEQAGATEGREFTARQSNLQAGRDADAQAQRAASTAAEGFAQRQADAGTQERNLEFQGRALESQERVARRPIATEDGTLGLLDSQGRLSPITGADGQPVRGARQPSPRELTGADLLRSYTDQRTKILEMSGAGGLDPEQSAAALAQLDADPLFASLRGGNAAPPIEGARRAPDGNWYVQNDDGSYSMVTE